MACSTLLGILKDCNGNLGGISKFYINNGDAITTSTVVDGVVTVATASTDFVEFQFNPNTSSYAPVATVDLATGSTFYLTTITLQLSRREAAKRQKLLLIAQGQPALTVIIKDSNGLSWIFGLGDDKVYLTGDEGGSGTAKGDLNGYLLTFTLEDALPAFEIENSVVEDLLGL